MSRMFSTEGDVLLWYGGGRVSIRAVIAMNREKPQLILRYNPEDLASNGSTDDLSQCSRDCIANLPPPGRIITGDCVIAWERLESGHLAYP
jgi:hypothetical protein